MRYILLIVICFICNLFFAQNQVGINEPAPDPSAVLEITSTDKGVLMPRMTAGNKSNISTPANGLVIYETSTASFWYFNNTTWIKITASNRTKDGIGDADSDTRIYLDATNDNDQIQFYLNGVRYFRMNRRRFDVINTGNSVFLGDSAGFNDDLVTNSNVYLGASAGLAGTNARRNVAIGYQSLRENQTIDNVALGSYSQRNGISARRCVTIGNNSLFNNKTSDQHIAIGAYAMENHVTENNTVALGIGVLRNDVSGLYNTAIGTRSLLTNTTSNYSTAIGYESGSLKNGTRNIYLGHQSGSTNGSSNRLYINNESTLAALLFGNFSTNLLSLNGSLRVSNNISYTGNITDVSDRRLKEHIKPITKVLPKIILLQGYKYHLKSQPEAQKEYGLIAQEVQKVFPLLVKHVDPNSDLLGVNYTQFIPLILEAEKEQLEQLKNLRKTQETIDQEVDDLSNELELIKAKVSISAAKH